MTSRSAYIFHPDCDLCARRRTRLECALKHLEYTRKRSLEDPALSNGFALGGAQRYVDEVRSSHPDHPMNPCPEPEGVQFSKGAPARSKPDENEEVTDINSEYTLKISFLKQQDIVERMMDLEKTLGIIVPGGYKYVDALRKLAVAILSQELKRPRKSQSDTTD
jgi:hypothetical protein